MSVEPAVTQTNSWRDAAGLVLGNWRDELARWAAESRAALRRPPLPPITLQIAPTQVAATLTQDGRTEDLGAFERNADGADALATRLGQAGALRRGRADCVLQLSGDAVLRSRARLPKTSSRALRGAMGFELKRLSPVPPAELYFDVAISRTDKATNRVELGSRAVRRRSVDDAIAFAASAGLRPAAIVLGDDAAEADWRYFPVDRGALLARLWKGWGSPILAATALVLLLGAAAAALARAGEQDAVLAARIAAELPRAAAVTEIERQVLALRDKALFVAQRKTRPSFVGTLAALSDALPDGTWLESLQIGDAGLHIQGYSRSASNLLVLLDQSGRFKNAQFGAPLVRNETDGSERFDIVAQIAGQP